MNGRLLRNYLIGICLFGQVGLVPLTADKSSFHFAYEISPILAKIGCSAAECHGGATGQGGFKLSLFAENPEMDYESIVHELDGRRLDFLVPSHSLFLRKPTRSGVKHKGGRLLHSDDRLYETLVGWIEDGALYRKGVEEDLSGIKIALNGGQCSVMASFESNRGTFQRDVTHLALLESSNEQVATIDELGEVQPIGAGETWFLARYGKFSSRVSFRSAYRESISNVPSSRRHPLDRIWLERLQSLGLNPATPANEFTLARRLYFDLTGRPPDPRELEAFLQLPQKERLTTTTKKLTQSDEFDRVFARSVASFFEIPVAGKDPRNAKQRNDQLRRFFSEAIRNGDSMSELAEKVLLKPDGQAAWQHFADPRDRAEYVGRTLLGMKIGCARCHNHPLDRWTNEEHLAFSAYFTDPRPGPKGTMMAGKFFLPGAGTAVSPKLLPVSLESPPSGLERNQELSWLVLDGAKEQFARNMANRFFELLVGRSLVSISNDHRITNPAVHVPVLELLAETFLSLDFDVRAFVQFVITSDLYAASSLPPNVEAVSGDPELRYLARRESKSLTSEQLKEAVEFVIGVPILADVPPDSPLARQLYLLNSGMLQKGLQTEGNQVDAILLFETDPRVQLQELFRLILSRPPREAENDAFLPVLEASDSVEKDFKDLALALLASREFGSVR
jgi:hypothetical protein